MAATKGACSSIWHDRCLLAMHMHQPCPQVEIPFISAPLRSKLRSAVQEEHGYTGAEATLFACVALGLILMVTRVLLQGVEVGADRAKHTLQGQVDTIAWSESAGTPPRIERTGSATTKNKSPVSGDEAADSSPPVSD